ncbi:hypothetical protein O1M63_22280 [Streptomyces mirabilis]|nr:hypothetical protein [Streptomyces mirabilis]
MEEAVSAWLAGASGPPAALATEPDLVPDLSARWLDSMAMLARHHLSTTPDERPPSEDPEKAAAHVTGALPGDALLAAGDPRRPSTPTGPTWPSNPSGQAPGRASGTP